MPKHRLTSGIEIDLPDFTDSPWVDESTREQVTAAVIAQAEVADVSIKLAARLEQLKNEALKALRSTPEYAQAVSVFDSLPKSNAPLVPGMEVPGMEVPGGSVWTKAQSYYNRSRALYFAQQMRDGDGYIRMHRLLLERNPQTQALKLRLSRGDYETAGSGDLLAGSPEIHSVAHPDVTLELSNSWDSPLRRVIVGWSTSAPKYKPFTGGDMEIVSGRSTVTITDADTARIRDTATKFYIRMLMDNGR